MLRMAKWLLVVMCSCTMAVASSVSDEEAGKIAQGIIDKYPNGWTCIRDMEQFCCEMNWWCPEPELINSDSEDEDMPHLNAEQRQFLSEITVNALYERTKEVLGGRNDNLLVSFLCFSKTDNEKTKVFNNLLEQYLAEHHINDHDKNKFLRDSLWSVQLDGMQRSNHENVHLNVNYGLMYRCISLSAGDENFIYNEIVAKMGMYGFGSMVPYQYRRE